ncbi:Hypothetical protein NTJ_12735 [Nesidiocoris tenuis]|uniref:Uncharacterized protein n=1 Tax=Nesidiocoris tenuis TaxID=355587 RepID=A0ABN7B6M2_9HEMI|nr:Hypothetical protein NTJ_12735 [Nesidiocoris tenuis]
MAWQRRRGTEAKSGTNDLSRLNSSPYLAADGGTKPMQSCAAACRRPVELQGRSTSRGGVYDNKPPTIHDSHGLLLSPTASRLPFLRRLFQCYLQYERGNS